MIRPIFLFRLSQGAAGAMASCQYDPRGNRAWQGLSNVTQRVFLAKV
jgi:hypothetical protein